jgi:hypothetical protein
MAICFAGGTGVASALKAPTGPPAPNPGSGQPQLFSDAERRRKISERMKGKVPWNKGRTLSTGVKASEQAQRHRIQAAPAGRSATAVLAAAPPFRSQSYRKKIKERGAPAQ